MIQTQFAHTITVPDEWEHDGHTFQVFQDEWAECPTEWMDSADALCVCPWWSAWLHLAPPLRNGLPGNARP